MIDHPDDDALTAEPLRRDVERHLEGCARCRVQVRLLRRFLDAALLEDEPSDPGSTSGIRDLLERDAHAVGALPLDTFGEVRLLGNGPRGPVYEGFDRARGRRVAIKVLAVPPAPGALAGLAAVDGRHPHLAPPLSVDPEGRFLSRALVDGEDFELATYHARPQRVLLWAGQAASALATLHAAGVVHGAVKPENLRVEAGGRLVLVDGGLGGWLSASPYRAPELGALEASEAGDWYGLGALLREHAPGLGLGGLVERLVDDDPAARPSAAEVLASLWIEHGEGGGLDATRYQFLDTLGEGGMGSVLRVYDPVLRRTVALKRMKGDLVGRGGAAARFQVEAQVTAQLQHPGIMPVYELGQLSDGSPYYTMKVVENRRTLSRMLHQRREGQAGVSLRQVLGVYVRVCEAMAYAHGRGSVIHRDLKPENVLVGDYGEVLVSDWGLAKVVDGGTPGDRRTMDLPDRGDTRTRDGAQAGTAGYMSPEQAAGEQERLGPPSDVFALGVVLYQVLTGTRPFGDGDPDDVLARTREGRWRPVLDVAPDAPRELAAVVDRAMALDPADRYPDAGALADDVAAYKADQDVAAYAYSMGERLARILRPYQGYLAVGSVAAALLVAVGLVALQSQQARVAAEAQGMLERAQLARVSGDRVRAELYAAEAVDLADRPEGRGILGALWREGYPGLVERRDRACEQVALTGTPGRVVCVDGGRAVSWTPGQPGELALGDDITAITAGPVGAAVLGSSGRIRVVDAVTGDALAELATPGEVGPVALVGDGHVVWADGDRLRSEDAETSPLGSEVVDLLACGPVSPVVVRLADDRVLRWDPTQPEPVVLDIDARRARTAACSSDGRLALAIGAEIDIWQLDPAREVARLTGHEASVTTLAWSRDDVWVASGSEDGTVRVWTTGQQQELARLPGHTGVRALAFGDEGTLVTATPTAVRTWDPPRTGGVPEVDAMVALQTHWWTDRGRLATLDRHGGVGTWDPVSGRPTESLRLPGTRAAAMGPEGLALVGASDGSLRVIDPATRTQRWSTGAHDGAVVAVAWDAPHEVVASAGQDGGVRSWHAITGQPLKTLREGGPPPVALAYSSDGSRLLLLDREGRVQLWSTSGGALAATAEGVTAAALDDTGERLAVGLVGGLVEVRSAASGRVLSRLRGHGEDVVSVAFSPGAVLAATASRDQTVRVYDVATGRELARVFAPLQRPSQVRFSPDGRVLSASGLDRTVLMWDVEALRAPRAGLVERVESRYGATVDGSDVTFASGTP